MGVHCNGSLSYREGVFGTMNFQTIGEAFAGFRISELRDALRWLYIRHRFRNSLGIHAMINKEQPSVTVYMRDGTTVRGQLRDENQAVTTVGDKSLPSGNVIWIKFHDRLDWLLGHEADARAIVSRECIEWSEGKKYWCDRITNSVTNRFVLLYDDGDLVADVDR